MASTRHLIGFWAALFVALWAMPSVALAHDGHAHRAPAAVETSPSAPDTSATHFDAIKAGPVKISFTASELTSDSGRSASGCLGGCCGKMTGMACCGAIIPSVIDAPPIELSALFVFNPISLVRGLPPEALPKPPKAFA